MGELALRRRDLLATAGLIAVARPAFAAPAPAIDPARFQAISSKLCGVTLDDLEFAQAIEAELLGDGGTDLAALVDLAAATPPAGLDAAISARGLDALADRLVAIWYSGMTGPPNAPRVLSFTSAAAWTAIGYTKPPTWCGPRFGAWADPPS